MVQPYVHSRTIAGAPRCASAASQMPSSPDREESLDEEVCQPIRPHPPKLAASAKTHSPVSLAVEALAAIALLCGVVYLFKTNPAVGPLAAGLQPHWPMDSLHPRRGAAHRRAARRAWPSCASRRTSPLSLVSPPLSSPPSSSSTCPCASLSPPQPMAPATASFHLLDHSSRHLSLQPHRPNRNLRHSAAEPHRHHGR